MQPDDDKTRTYVALESGTMVSHYRIIEKIGAGGMGEVYLAEDTKLDRKVALKFLPQHLCQNADCRSRFTREAQASAKLDHPNIVAVHEVGEYNGRPFFSMQHVEGQTLKEVIAGKPLPLDRIVEIAIQVCEGLQTAHEKGITHRDIKPSNILIDSHGRARIVDFGLASVLGTDPLTKTGSTLGTIGYMSPEQVRGDKVDHRTDLFSLGVVLYELITGHSPFKADSEAATLHAITSTKPELLARFRREIPIELQTIIDKALEKDIATRYQHADELAADLKRLIRLSGEHTPQSTSRSTTAVTPRLRFVYLLAAVLLLTAGLTAVWLFLDRHSTVTAPVPIQKQITLLGDVLSGTISPDGKQVAFFRRSEHKDSMALLVQDLSGGDPLVLVGGVYVGPSYGTYNLPRWSPDGTEIAFADCIGDQRGVFVVPRLGGSFRTYPFRVCTDAIVAWSPDGSRLLYHHSCGNKQEFHIISTKDGTSQRFLAHSPVISEFVLDLEWFPDGRNILMRMDVGGRSEIWAVRLEDGNGKYIGGGSGQSIYACALTARGDAVYYLTGMTGSSGRSLMRQTIDPVTCEVVGNPVQLITGLQSFGPVSVSADQRRLLYLWNQEWSNLWLVRDAPSTSLTMKKLTDGTAQIRGFDISRDGRQIAFDASTQDNWEVFVMDADGRHRRQLTSAGGAYPHWSPDGKSVAFAARDSAGTHLAITSASGGPAIPLPKSQVSDQQGCIEWGPNGTILYQSLGNRNFHVRDLATGRETTLLSNDSLGWIFSPRISPQGDRVVAWWNRAPQRGLWLISLTDSSQTYLSPIELYSWILGWSPDANYVYFTQPGTTTVLRLNISRSVVDTALVLPVDLISASAAGVAMLPDCQSFVCNRLESRGEIYLIENFDPNVK